MSKGKIYLSGGISGRNYDVVEAEFYEAEQRLQKKGYEVVNPLNNGLTTDHLWQEHMRADLKLMLECDTIYMLKGWRASKGAKIEYELALTLGFSIIEQVL